MRVYPPVPKDEVLEYLTTQAKLMFGDQPVHTEVLDTVAEALAMIGAIEVPDDCEPLAP